MITSYLHKIDHPFYHFSPHNITMLTCVPPFCWRDGADAEALPVVIYGHPAAMAGIGINSDPSRLTLDAAVNNDSCI